MAIKHPYNAAGVVGVHSSMDKSNVITRIAAEDGIGFGVPVMRGSEGKQAVVWDGTSAALGVTMFRNEIDPAQGFKDGDNLPVLNEGQLWVFAAGDCTAGGIPEYDPVLEGFKDATDPDDAMAMSGARFENDVKAGGVVRLQVHTRLA